MQVLNLLKADRETIRRWLMRNRGTLFLYFALFVFVLGVYHLFSDGDFSFLLTVGSIVIMFAFSILLMKIASQQSVSGVSVKTLQLYAGVFFFRCCSILVYDGYLPFDRSGDWLYQVVEAGSMILAIATIVLCMSRFRSTYDRSYDIFGTFAGMPTELGALWLFLPCLLVAMLVHPSLNQNFFTDTAWTLAMYLEGVAVLPQLVLFQRKGGEIEPFTSHFVVGLGVGRLLSLLFWVSSYHELNDRYVAASLSGGWFVGYIVLASQIVQLLLMGDYMFYYVKSLRSGGPMLLPTAHV